MANESMTKMQKLKAGLPYRYDDPELVQMKDTAPLRCARLNAVGALEAAALCFAALLAVVLAAPNSVCVAWAEEHAGVETLSLSALSSASDQEAMGGFDVPEGDVWGTWGSDDYAAKWYLADGGDTLVVGPGIVCSSSRSGSTVQPDFNGMRASVKVIRFTQEAFIYPTASSLFEGFESLEAIEGMWHLSGEHGVLGASNMFKGCSALKAVSIGSIKFSSVMEHPYEDIGMGVSDVTTNCSGAFEGCTALEELDLGKGWRSGYVGLAVFGPEDVIYDQRATFPVDMTDGASVYAAGTPIPDGVGHYWKVAPGNEKLMPTISLKKSLKTVTAKAAKSTKQSFRIGASTTSGSKLTYKVVKSNSKISFKDGKATLKRGNYKKGSSYSMRVKVTSAETNRYAKAQKSFKLIFKIKG